MMTQSIAVFVIFVLIANVISEYKNESGIFWPITLGVARTVIMCACTIFILALAAAALGHWS